LLGSVNGHLLAQVNPRGEDLGRMSNIPGRGRVSGLERGYVEREREGREHTGEDAAPKTSPAHAVLLGSPPDHVSQPQARGLTAGDQLDEEHGSRRRPTIYAEPARLLHL
jgi:hypothetical protein